MDEKIKHDSMAGKFEPSFKDRIKLAFQEFLWIPAVAIAIFILLAALTFVLDNNKPAWADEIRSLLEFYFFRDAEMTHDFLGTMVGGLMTVVSITISMLLVVLQQSSNNHGTLVFDQFLNRRRNQVYIGYFAAALTFIIITYSFSGKERNLIFGTALTFLFSIGTVAALVVLLYSTINQMRPEVIIGSVHDEALRARKRQLPFIKQTRRHPEHDWPVIKTVRSTGSGFVTIIQSKPYEDLLKNFSGEYEIELIFSYGEYLNLDYPIAHIRAPNDFPTEAIERAILRSIILERQRTDKYDTAYSILQLEMIGWTASSTAKHIPESGLLVIKNMGDLLARWTYADDDVNDPGPPLPLSYQDDLFEQVIDSLESLAVVASESQQHMVYAEVLDVLTGLFDRLPSDLKFKSASRVNRIIPGLQHHILTEGLENDLQSMVIKLYEAGYQTIAQNLEQALDKKRAEVGKIPTASGGSG